MSSSHMFYEYPFPFKFTTFHPKKRINVVCVRRVLMGHNNFRLAQIIRANSNRLEGSNASLGAAGDPQTEHKHVV